MTADALKLKGRHFDWVRYEKQLSKRDRHYRFQLRRACCKRRGPGA